MSPSYRLAQLLSVVFHPLLVPTYGTICLLAVAPPLWPPRSPVSAVLASVVGGTLLLPGIGTWLLIRAGHGSSLLLPERHTRHWPLLLATAGFGLTAALLRTQWPLLATLVAAQTVAVALTWLVTRYWLISAHGVGMGGTAGLLLALGWEAPDVAHPWLLTALAAATGLAVAVAWARLRLRAHTPAQVAAGLTLGFLTGLSALLGLP